MRISDLRTLDRATCLELIQDVPVGRIAWADERGRVHLLPVNFIVDDESLVFRTAAGGKLDAALENRLLTFETDDLEPALRTAWSVLVTGRAEVVGDEEEIRRLDALPLAPWIPSPKPFFVRLTPDEVTGRRIPLHPGGVTVEHLGPSDEPV